MPRTRKKKNPVTNTDKASSSSNPHSSRTVIRRFHVLLKKQRQLKHTPASATNAQELGDVEREIEEMGGLAVYQRMSSVGQGNDRGGGSEKVLIQWLINMGLQKREDKGKLK